MWAYNQTLHCLQTHGFDLFVNTVPPDGRMYSLQHTLRDLHVVHGHHLRKLLQALDVADLFHELHAAEAMTTTMSCRP